MRALRSGAWIFGVGLSLVASAAFAQSAPTVSVMGEMGGLNYSGTGSMSGADAGVGTTTQSQSLNHTTAAGGGAVDITSGALENFHDLQSLCIAGAGDATCAAAFYGLLEIAALDPGRATASFSGLSAGPLGTGTSFFKEKWSIPVALGVGASATKFGINIPALSFYVKGGVSFDEFQAGFNLTELGAPGGPGTSASNTYWEADPLVGVGARYYLSRNVFVGVNSTWAFARSHSVSAPSANFAPFENYTLNTGSHTLTTVMFNLGWTFGDPPVSSKTAMVTKAR